MEILGARGKPGKPEDRLAAVRESGNVQLLDARMVLGRDHLLTAIEHAERATREGTNTAKTLAVEVVLYVSGERQIADALAKVGIRADTTEFAVVVFGGDSDAVLDALALTRDDIVLDFHRQKAKAFGFTDAELDSVPPERVRDLVLERVALVDLLK